jgi:hypothetical protein
VASGIGSVARGRGAWAGAGFMLRRVGGCRVGSELIVVNECNRRLISSLVIHGWICSGQFNDGNFDPHFQNLHPNIGFVFNIL